MSKNKHFNDFTVDIVIPVLNEAHVLEKSIAIVMDFLKTNVSFAWKIVIVDNGSTDGTYEVAQCLSDTYKDVHFVHLEEKGRGRALRETWQNSTADIVLYTDVDLSTELAAIPKVIMALTQEGYDIAIGSRLCKESKTQRCLKREITSRVYNLFIKCVLFTKFSDAQCGFKALTREIVDVVIPQVKDQSWFFDTELLVLAEKQGYKIKDIPVVWIEDDDTRVKIIPTAWEDIKGVLRLRWHLIKNVLIQLKILRKRSPIEGIINKSISNTPDK